MIHLARPILAVAILAFLAAPSVAQDSRYTPLDLGACAEQSTDNWSPLVSGVWECEGLDGIRIFIVESDLRFLVSFGPNAEAEPALEQTLPHFNYLGDTIEWRLDAEGNPIATIIRYFADGDIVQLQYLVVTRLAGPVCQIAYVDAIANPDANEKARAAAARLGEGFSCDANTPVFIGAGGF